MKHKDPMIWAWAGWEPLQFYRRQGGFHEHQEANAEWSELWYDKLHSRECAKALARSGVNWVTTHFYKGYGLEIEAEEIARAKELIENYHAEGVQVFTYIQYGTISNETMPLEVAGSEKWKRVNEYGQHTGHPYEYGDNYHRSKADGRRPEFIAYLKRVIDEAISANTDGIWLDNLNADGCHGASSQKAFQDYLRKHVNDPWQELGLRDLARVRIPTSAHGHDPLYQLWTRFRCEETRENLKALAEHAKARKPEVLFAVNMGMGNHRQSLAENGNWVANLDCVDYSYAENGRFARWEGDEFVSQHPCMKMASARGIKIVPGAGIGLEDRAGYPRAGTPGPEQLRLVFAESASMGAQAYGGPWGLRGLSAGTDMDYLADPVLKESTRALAEFYRKNHELFNDSSDAAPIAILSSFEAELSDHEDHSRATHKMEQLLMQNQLPFRYVFSDHMDNLEKLQLIILPNVLPVDDFCLQHLKDFVRDGGKVLLTGRSSLYNRTRGMRNDYGLATELGVSHREEFETQYRHSLYRNPQNGCMICPGRWGLEAHDGSIGSTLSDIHLVDAIRGSLKGIPQVSSPQPHLLYETRQCADGSSLHALINFNTNQVISGATISLDHAESVQVFDSRSPNLAFEKREYDDSHSVLFLPPIECELYIKISP